MTVNDVVNQRRIRAVAHVEQIGKITQAAAVFGISRQTGMRPATSAVPRRDLTQLLLPLSGERPCGWPAG